MINRIANWLERRRKARHLRWMKRNKVWFMGGKLSPDGRNWSDEYMRSLRHG
jgi:hypothetical protein